MKVSVLSFSYKCGLPEDETGNGGGFVFDCRAMPNPFWDETLRGFSGCDKPVVDFFEQHKDKVDCFLDAAETLVCQSIVQYQKDGREHLQVAFGCTGGQHRSVYLAERMAERLNGIEGVEVEVCHAAREYWKIFTGKGEKHCVAYKVSDIQCEILTEDTAVDVQVQCNMNVKEKNDCIIDVCSDDLVEKQQKAAATKLKFKKQDGTLIDPDEILTIEEQQELRNLNSSLFIGKSSVWITEFLKRKMHGRLIAPLDVRRFYHFIKNYYVLKNLPSNEEGTQEIFSPVIILGDNGQRCPHCGVRVKKLQKHIKKVHPQFYKPPIIPRRKHCDSVKSVSSNKEKSQPSLNLNIATGKKRQPCPHCGRRVPKLQKHIRKAHPQFYKPPITPSANRLLRNPPPDPEDVMREIYGDW